MHVCVDDATRLAYAEVLPDERATTAIAFLRRALAHLRRHGVEVERVLTDNGSAYRSTLHAIACRALGLRHLRTRPGRPQTNGKAERLIRSMLDEWTYGAIYASSAERTAALDGWLWTYNHRRKHRALGRRTPAARLAELNKGSGPTPSEPLRALPDARSSSLRSAHVHVEDLPHVAVGVLERPDVHLLHLDRVPGNVLGATGLERPLHEPIDLLAAVGRERV